MLEMAIRAFAAHYIGDFAFQQTWMNQRKGTSWHINYLHAVTYTAAFVLLEVNLSLISLAIILISHCFIDPLKARWRIIKCIWLDQALHFAVLVFVLIVEYYNR